MQTNNQGDKLFTPGPLNVSDKVRSAMNCDYGSRDPNFCKKITYIRSSLLKLAHTDEERHTGVLIQGSGTYAVEATMGTAIPKNPELKLLVLINGAYGKRMVKIAEYYNIPYYTMEWKENEVIDAQEVERFLEMNTDVGYVSFIHHETTSGALNPLESICEIIKKQNNKIVIMVDAMSSFGAIDIDINKCQVDYLISSFNKCIQGVPGLAFVIANKLHLMTCEGNARSLSLDLYDQELGLSKFGQFRFTPGTHVIAAFAAALEELFARGGVPARFKRYSANQTILSEGLKKLGFKIFVPDKHQGCILTTILSPVHENFQFNNLYKFLEKRHILIYPGKLTKINTFRLGSIGEIYPKDCTLIIELITEFLEEQKIPVPVSYEVDQNEDPNEKSQKL